MPTANEKRVTLPPAMRKYLRELGRRGGKARAKNLDKKTLRAQAQHAASFRWKSAKASREVS
jgi:hypothetical protein